MPLRGWWGVGALLLGLSGVAVWLLTHQGGPGASTDQVGQAPSGWDMLGADPHASSDPIAASATSALTPEQTRNKLYKHGSFAGTEPAGDWCVSNDKLSACPELRKRFEYYILGLGEVSIADIKALVYDEAARAHGEKLAAEIMSIWDKYWQVRTHEWRNRFVQSDRSTWMAVFEEQRLVRRQILGADWARAFFDDEEKSFQQYYAQLESGQAPLVDPGEPVPQMAPGKDPAAVRAERVARYGEAAADRLTKADDEWADWERRLAAARVAWDRLKNAPELSDPQRQQSMSQYISEHFKPDEVRRVEVLLHL